MPWARFETDLVHHPKLEQVPARDRAAAFALYLAAIGYCAEMLTDGRVTRVALLGLAEKLGVKRAKTTIETLEKVRLLEREQGGKNATRGAFTGVFVIHDYLDYQPSKEEVLAKRTYEREKKRKARSQMALDVPTNVPEGLSPSLSPGDSRAHVRGRTAEAEEPKELRAEGFALDAASATGEVNGLPVTHEFFVSTLLAAIGSHGDEGTPAVVRALVRGLPEASMARVVESLRRAKPKDRAAYVVGALKSEHDRDRPFIGEEPS